MGDLNSFSIKRIGTYDLSGTRLGKGNFAFVELAFNRVTKSKVAVKVIDTRKIKDDYVKRNILREALLLKRAHHPNIVKLYETLKQRGVYCLVTEYIPGGELLGLIRSHQESRLSETQARPIVRQIVSALHHLHEQGIVHRDLKMENILLDESKKTIKIVDFGLSNKYSGGELLKTQCGSPEYAAPELFKKGCRYGGEVDIWSLGIITFGMVVGKLPFRTPHSGGRGRNDLVDQMSRGLNAIHSKYLATLSPECRDVLRKLLEPNPQLRISLTELMAHPWLTSKGTWPLEPYVAPEVDPQIIAKVLDKVSALTKMPKSKIEMHLSRNRYDTVSGIYNLILDDEVRQYAEREKMQVRNKRDKHVAWQHRKMNVDNQSTDAVIKVSIKHNGHKQSHDKQSHDKQSHAKQSHAKQSHANNEDNSTRQEQGEVNDNMERVKREETTRCEQSSPLDILQIRGLKMCQVGPQQRRTSACSRSRSCSADRTEPRLTAQERHHHRSSSVPAHGRPQSTQPRLKQSTATGQNTTITEESEVHGKHVTSSPRWGKPVGCSSPDIVENEETEEKQKEDNGPVESPEHSKTATKVQPTHGRNKSAVTRQTHSPATVSTIAWADRANGTLQRRLAKTPKHMRSAQKTPAHYGSQGKGQSEVTGLGPVSQSPDFHAPTPDTVYNWPEYRKLCSQSAKDNRPRKLGDVTRNGGKSEKDLCEVIKWSKDKGKITDNMYAIYQRYLANCKPHHKRLSIMQAQEILQHDYKFHAKYGRKSSPDVNEKEDVFDADENKNSSERNHKGFWREKKPQSCVKTYPGVTLKEEQRELVLHASQCNWKKAAIQESNLTSKESEGKATKGSEEETGCSGGMGKKQEKLTTKQEESLKRQKHRELAEEVDREQKRVERELQDTERVALIEHYLDDIYTKYSVKATTLQLNKTPDNTHAQKNYTKTCRGKLYSWLPMKRPRVKTGNLANGIFTKPASILQSSHGKGLIDKKITFKEQLNGKNANPNIRYFNDWSKTAFINYVNSEGEFQVDETDHDLSLQLQLKDARYWLQRHMSGVVAKSSTKNVDSPTMRQA
ncbi:MAP/microtubule affinity-regulating kinase 3-like [Nematostella vectensis]|uniref:MAP/microtubule affinity-regulating kinase 3-like n=1 Tax=Nematostella vectensis TaxID=45351 RepID=UPI0020775992|nr:MAP/microtubule affinity-regulating kinase 3-like [Nematostella vectensis]